LEYHVVKEPSLKHFISFCLIILISASASFAMGFDKEKLLTLKPLCSERLAKQAVDRERTKLWECLVVGGTGLWTMIANTGGGMDNYKLANLTFGLSLATSGVLIYSTPGEDITHLNTLQEMGLSGIEKEETAYSMLKSTATRSRAIRTNSGIVLVVTGLGWALLAALSDSATQSYKNNMYLGAAGFIATGLFTYLNPGAGEKEIEEIDKTVWRQ
jgi:hypothetical protein